MSCRLEEVQAAPAVVVVDLAWLGELGPWVVRDAGRLYPREAAVELIFGDEEGVVLRGNRLGVAGREVERDAVAGDHRKERAKSRADLEAEDAGEELGRDPAVLGGNDGVVELDRHRSTNVSRVTDRAVVAVGPGRRSRESRDASQGSGAATVDGVKVDLRSDTLTRPTESMRRAMADAEVGDDQYGEDPTVNALEEEAAALLGKEAALYVVSGTMANQLALRVLTRPGDGVIAGGRQHVVLYEDGAGPLNAGIGWLAVDDEAGAIDPDEVDRVAAGVNHHTARASLVCIEDTHMASGGLVWSPESRRMLASVAAARGLKVHLDGARLWHAAVTLDRPPADIAVGTDTVMCCLSKGLGAPIGSVLAGTKDTIDAARLERHRLGGAWRQAGIVAAAGLVALRTMRSRLADDHARAARLAAAAAARWPEAGLDPATVVTNIVVFSHPDTAGLLAYLGSEGVLAGTVAPGRVRLVTHLDVDDAGIERACEVIAAAPA